MAATSSPASVVKGGYASRQTVRQMPGESVKMEADLGRILDLGDGTDESVKLTLAGAVAEALICLNDDIARSASGIDARPLKTRTKRSDSSLVSSSPW